MRTKAPRGPTAQPLPSGAKATLFSGRAETGDQWLPPSQERSAPVGPTATSQEWGRAPGRTATAER